MVIYADVLVAINYFICYAMLCAAGCIAGIPLGRRSKVRGALAGGFVSLVVFLPLQGFWFGIAARFLSALVMLLAAWPGRSKGEYLRLGVILLCVSFVFAGAVLGLCLLWPSGPVSFPGGMFYFEVSPLLLLLSVTLSYLLLGVVKRFYREGRIGQMVCTAELSRGDQKIELRLMQDSGNRLTEPFSGLPVAVCTLQAVLPLLTHREVDWIAAGMPTEKLPQGMRLIPFRSVGAEGMLPALRPDRFDLKTESGERYDYCVWVAVHQGEMPGCDGVFDPSILQLRI